MASVSAFSQGETCATAVSVPGSGLYSADGPQTGGGNDNGCFFGGTNADWYSFTPICDGEISVTNDIASNGGNPEIRLSIYSGACGSLTCEATGPVNNGTVNNLAVTGGVTYLIEFDDSWNGANQSGAFDWTLDFQITGGVTGINASPQITSGVISWVPAGLEPCWSLEWGPSGFAPGSGTVVNIDSINSSFYILPNTLSPETTYDYYIAVCDANGNNTGCYDGPHQMTTLPLCPVPDNIVVTPATTTALLDWDPGFTETSWEVEYGPFGTVIGAGTQSTELQSSKLVQGLTACTDYHWYVRAVCDNYNPIEFSNWVGPIDFTTDCPCPAPDNLSASEVSPDPVDAFDYLLSWDAGGTETAWNIEYGEPGFLSGSGTIVSANTNVDFLLTGLSPDTEYCYYVQADCGPDGTSEWEGPFCFTTNTYCPVPTGLGISNLTTISAQIQWNIDGSSNNWTIEWGPVGFAQGTGTISPVLSNNAILTGLTPETEYCYYVQSNCGMGPDSSSVWSPAYCFTTLAACPQPNNLDAFNITGTAATLDWQPGASENDWNIEWGIPGFTPGIGDELGSGTSSGTSNIYATGLNAGAPYEFYVQADCGGLDGTSLWSGPYSFSTLLTNDQACGAIELLVDGSVNLHTNFGATLNGEQSIEPLLNGTHDEFSWYLDATWNNPEEGVTDPVWFRFKAPASGKVEVSTVNDLTESFEQRTEIAVYETGNCAILNNFQLLAANSFAFGTLNANDPNFEYGSRVLLCDLNPGQQYYVMVDHYDETWTPANGSDPGPFGISVTDIPSTDAGVANPLDLCGDGEPFDLFDAIDNYGSTTGTWYNPSITNPTQVVSGNNSVISLPPGNGSYSFEYVISNVCGADSVQTTINTSAPPNAGMDGSFSQCNIDDVILVQHLNGFVEFGGTWVDPNGVHDVSDGVFNAYGVQFGAYPFYYIVQGNGSCPNDTAVVTINLHDGCLGLDNNVTSTLEVYPNPVNDVLTISNVNIEGNALISVYDAQGKVVFRNDVTNNSNYTIDMSALEAGIYMVEVTSETTSEKVRVIKQ